MPPIILYLVKLSCSLSIIWLFYRLVLRNLTFYTMNRWYLLGYSLLSFVIPFVNIGPIYQEDRTLQPVIIQYIPVIDKPWTAAALPKNLYAQWDYWHILLLLIGVGSCFYLIRFLIRWYSLRQMRRQAVLLQEGPIRIFRVAQPIAPFSFGNAIYINPGEHTEKEWEEIILHEYVHIRQRHTLDILLAELLVITNWYNPFAWLIRYSVRQNLEFIADRAVVAGGVDRKGYQYHLLKVVGQNRYRLANNFNFSSLKKRIIMMNKIRSARLHLLRFLFILPLLAVLLVAFRDRFPLHHSEKGHHSEKDLFVNAAGIVISLPERTPIAGVTVTEVFTGLQTATDSKGYYKLKIPITGDSARVHLDFSKQGYQSGLAERFWPSLKQTTGMCAVGTVDRPSMPHTGFFMISPNVTANPPADPNYEDALYELQRVLDDNDQLTHYMSMEKAHPEIALWYIAEDHLKRILVHTDGTAERFGYPHTPTLADMDAKYGSLPAFMTEHTHTAGSGYLARWAAISAQAEKDFHPAKGNPKAIIFPGDSRVIAVSADGKARIYDMDNDDPKERPAFEQTYGPLPACVPPGFHYAPLPALPRVGPPRSPDTTKPPTILSDLDGSRMQNAIYLVDGVIREKSWIDANPISPNDIASVTILKGEKATQLFGRRGLNGVIAIITKANTASQPPILITDHAHPSTPPLYVVDGVPRGDAIKDLNPNDIARIDVLRDTAAMNIYGDKGRYGVILITTKKNNGPHIVLDATTPDGKAMKIIADSLHTPLGNIHAENGKH